MKALQTYQMAANPGKSNFPPKLMVHRQVHEVNPEHKGSSERQRLLRIQAATQGSL